MNKFEELLRMKVKTEAGVGSERDIEMSPQFLVKVQEITDEYVKIIIHADGHNSDTLDYYVVGDELIPLVPVISGKESPDFLFKKAKEINIDEKLKNKFPITIKNMISQCEECSKFYINNTDKYATASDLAKYERKIEKEGRCLECYEPKKEFTLQDHIQELKDKNSEFEGELKSAEEELGFQMKQTLGTVPKEQKEKIEFYSTKSPESQVQIYFLDTDAEILELRMKDENNVVSKYLGNGKWEIVVEDEPRIDLKEDITKFPEADEFEEDVIKLNDPIKSTPPLNKFPMVFREEGVLKSVDKDGTITSYFYNENEKYFEKILEEEKQKIFYCTECKTFYNTEMDVFNSADYYNYPEKLNRLPDQLCAHCNSDTNSKPQKEKELEQTTYIRAYINRETLVMNNNIVSIKGMMTVNENGFDIEPIEKDIEEQVLDAHKKVKIEKLFFDSNVSMQTKINEIIKVINETI